MNFTSNLYRTIGFLVILIFVSRCGCVDGLTEDGHKTRSKVRPDGRCGARWPYGGQSGKCDPKGQYPCCSPYGWCGIAPEHCDCQDCVDFRAFRVNVRDDLRCGSEFPINGQPAKCDEMSDFPCCSGEGRCGISEKHCKCETCIDYREDGRIWYCGVTLNDKDGPIFRSTDWEQVVNFALHDRESRAVMKMRGHNPLFSWFNIAGRSFAPSLSDPSNRHYVARCHNAEIPLR